MAYLVRNIFAVKDAQQGCGLTRVCFILVATVYKIQTNELSQIIQCMEYLPALSIKLSQLLLEYTSPMEHTGMCPTNCRQCLVRVLIFLSMSETWKLLTHQLHSNSWGSLVAWAFQSPDVQGIQSQVFNDSPVWFKTCSVGEETSLKLQLWLVSPPPPKVPPRRNKALLKAY